MHDISRLLVFFAIILGLRAKDYAKNSRNGIRHSYQHYDAGEMGDEKLCRDREAFDNKTIGFGGKSKVDRLGEILKKRVQQLRWKSNRKVELVFLVDSSTSVGEENFLSELRFVKKLLADFTVDRNKTRVSVITFSSKSRVIRHVDHMTTPRDDNHKCSLLEEEMPDIEYLGGATYTLGAVLEAQKVLKSARPDAHKAIFLITDGYSNAGDPLPPARILRKENVEIFSFGIQNGNFVELCHMASAPRLEHTYILDSFDEFEALARRALHQDLQSGSYLVQKRSRCHHLCVARMDCCDARASCRCGTHTGHYICVCKKGFYGSGIVGGCLPCPEGTYKNTPDPGDQSTCKPCPDRAHWSPANSTSVDQCVCRLGYRPVGRHACAVTRCPELRAPKSGRLVHGRCDNVFNAACGTQCNHGYTLHGSSVRLCLSNGTWSGTEATCTVKRCPPQRTPKNGNMRCSKDDFSFGTDCHFLCNDGYKMINSRVRSCLPNSIWSGITPKCKEIECDPLPELTDGYSEPRHCTTHKSPYGTRCQLFCSHGYKLLGRHSKQCSSDGMWVPHLDNQCVDRSPPSLTCPPDLEVAASRDENTGLVNWADPLAFDNSGFIPTVTIHPVLDPPVQMPIGSHKITYTAEDSSRNAAKCSFKIRVKDTQPPRIDKCVSPPPFVRRKEEAFVDWKVPEFSDNSGNWTVKASDKPRVFPLGETNVTYKAYDDAGNNNTCVIHIIVKENACANPSKPINGDIKCMSRGGAGVECTLSCHPGHGFAIPPADTYTCQYDTGEWQPEDYLPFPDCSESRMSNNVTQQTEVRLRSRESCEDRMLINQLESNFDNRLKLKVKEFCHPGVICHSNSVTVRCTDRVFDNENEILTNQIDETLGVPHVGRRRRSVSDNSLPDHPVIDVPPTSDGIKRIIRVAFEIQGSMAAQEDTITSAQQQSLRNAIDDVVLRLKEVAFEGLFDEVIANQPIYFSGFVTPKSGPLFVCTAGSVLTDSNCVKCPVGTKFNVVSEQCEGCPRGTYQPHEGVHTCLVCPSNTSTSSNSSKSLRQCKGQCLPGSVSEDGLDPCETCPVGEYMPTYARAHCLPCPNNTTTWRRGTRTADKCGVICPRGYVSKRGLAPCFACPQGYFQPDEGRSSCFLCPNSAKTRLAGSTSRDDCEGGDIVSTELYPVPTSELVINKCFEDPCRNDATCLSVGVGYSCTCIPGWAGDNCELEVDECLSNPCHNNATCTDYLAGYNCTCRSGFTGALCEVNVNECESGPCANNGTCVDGDDGFHCLCANGFTGALCEEDIDECASRPCLNKATCIDAVDSYTCACALGYQGSVCESDIDECESDPCVNNATCADSVAAFICACNAGFSGWRCELPIDECLSSPCAEGATCVDHLNGYVCMCPPAYSGVHCQTKLNSTFDLEFDELLGVTDYVLLDQVMPNMTSLTLSFWMRTTDKNNYGTPVSYANSEHDNALTMTDYNGFTLYINGAQTITDITSNDGRWHHLCITWSGDTGRWRIYRDGKLKEHGHMTGGVLLGGGSLVIGQEVDMPGGRVQFADSEAFIGSISAVNLWDYVFSDEQVTHFMGDCEEIIGNVLAWPDFLAGIHGRVTTRPTELCLDCPQPQNITDGDITYNGTQINAVLQYTCHYGYVFQDPGDPTRRCGVDSMWSGVEPYCIRVSCGRPADVTWAQADMMGRVHYGDNVTYQCRPGYRLVGADTLYCGGDGTFIGTLPSCNQITCKQPELTLGMRSIRFKPQYTASERQTLSCTAGYQFRTPYESTIICTDNGTWSIPYPECKAIICPPPPSIANGKVSGDTSNKTYFSKDKPEVRYECDWGYQMGSGRPRTSRCLGAGKWNTPPRCNQIKCNHPGVVVHGSADVSNYTFGGLATYQCDKGYKLVGIPTLQCDYKNKWNNTLPKCEQITCPEPERDSFSGSITQSGVLPNDTLMYSCTGGYVLHGAVQRRCSAEGEWSDDAPMCQRIRCHSPESVKHGALIGGDAYFADWYANFTCDEGYDLIGKPDIRCGQDGEWKDAIPTCAPMMCPDPEELENGRWTGNDGMFLFKESIEYKCNIGFEISGSPTRECMHNKTWSGELPKCKKIKCSEPDTINNGKHSQGTYEVGSTVKYTCDKGFYPTGKDTRTCRTDGTWTGPPAKCSRVTCGEPKKIDYGNYVLDEMTYGSTMEYVCDQGYELSGESVRMCNEDKLWNGSEPQCMSKSCPPPDEIKHGQHYEYEGKSPASKYVIGSTVSFKCEPGYELNGPSQIQCLDNNAWSDDVPFCEIVECDKPSRVISNGRMMGDANTFGATVRYECDPGYLVEGQSTRTCSQDGIWDNPIPVCQRIRCSTPPRPDSCYVQGSDYRYQEKVSFVCKQGYKLVGNAEITCQADGTWSEEIPQSVKIKCSRPSDPTNGTTNVRGLFYNNAIRYQCNVGFFIDGPRERICQANQTWSGVDPQCKEIKCGKPPLVQHGRPMYDIETTRIGDIVKYKCQTGFKVKTPGSITCKISGNYTKELPVCEHIQCAEPVNIPHASMTFNGTSIGDIANYSCHDFYNFTTLNDYLVCNVTGHWAGGKPICVKKSCNSPTQTANARLSMTDDNFIGSHVSYTCIRGYTILGNAVIKCLPNTTWSGPSPTCKKVECDAPSFQFGYVASSYGREQHHRNPRLTARLLYDITVTLNCEDGFVLDGPSEMRCLDNGSWSENFPTCNRVKCPQPVIENAHMNAPQGFYFARRLIVTCNTGFEILGDNDIYCGANKSWSSELPKCKAVACSPPQLLNGYFTVVIIPNFGVGYPFGMTLNFKCNSGYELLGDTELVCQSDKEWSSEIPTCTPITCQKPKITTQERVLEITNETESYNFGEVVAFKCQVGYSLRGTNQLKCSNNSQWDGSLPSCRLVHCPQSDINHGYPLIDGVAQERSFRVTYGMNISVECERGYELSPEVDRNTQYMCNSQSEYENGPLPNCQPKICPKVEILNGYYSLRGDQTALIENAVIYIACDDGYALNGTNTLKCMRDGVWSDAVPVCEKVKCPNPRQEGAIISMVQDDPTQPLSYGDEIRVTCDEGYELEANGGVRSLVCMENGHWSGELPHCIKNKCPFPIVRNGIIHDAKPGHLVPLTQDNELHYRDVINITCDVGYIMEGENLVSCEKDTTWSKPLPQCNIIHCPPINVEHIGRTNTSLRVFGTPVLIECSIGYELFGDSVLVCSLGGHWSSAMPRCTMTECPQPSVTNGRVNGTSSQLVSGFAFGDNVSFHCNAGYDMEGSSESTCMPDKTWSNGIPTCLPVVCTTPDGHIENGITILRQSSANGTYTYGTEIEMVCEEGYHIDGLSSINCMASGEWSGAMPVCVITECPSPLQIEHSVVRGRARSESGNYTFGDTIMISCIEGFVLEGYREMFCEPQGEWSSTFPVCQRRTCPSPNPIKHGSQISGTSYKYGDAITYSCQYGYTIETTPDVLCLANSMWGSLPECVPIKCSYPPDIRHGSFAVSGLEFGAKSMYACNPGYKLEGQQDHTCLGDKTWGVKIPVCVKVKCSDLLPPVLYAMPDLRVLDTSLEFNKTVSYVCEEGYSTEHDIETKCLQDGSWRDIHDSCKIINCGRPPNIWNGRHTASSLVYNATVLYQCNTGFVANGEVKRKCQANGKWSGRQPTCEIITCSMVEMPANGLLTLNDQYLILNAEELARHSGGSLGYMDRLMYLCNDGYELQELNEPTIACKADGTWSSNVPKCVKVPCNIPPIIPQGSVRSKASYFGDLLLVKCNKGYEHTGKSKYALCNMEGNWNISGVKCSIIHCEKPRDILHGAIIGDSYIFDSSISYDCHAGFELQGLEVRVCLNSKRWFGADPMCAPLTCPRPERINNGYYETNSSIHHYVYNTTVFYGCNEGYKLIGESSSDCQSDSSWSGALPTCRKVHCNALNPIPHGEVIGGDTVYAATIKYQCEIGFDLVGASTRTCQQDGQWSESTPNCVIVSCKEPNQVEHGLLTGNTYTYTSVIIYSCFEGYRLGGESEITCLASGDWSLSVPECKPKFCPTPPQHEYGYITLMPAENDLGLHNFTMGAIIHYVCDLGYFVDGSNSLTCIDGEDWSDYFPRCKPVSCGEPPLLTYSRRIGDAYNYGDKVSFDCIGGYFKINSTEHICQADGTWSVSKGRCKPVSCGFPPKVPHASYHGDSYLFNMSIFYKCDPGHNMDGNNLLRCGPNSKWLGTLPRCVMVSCGNIPVIPFASAVVSRTTFGARIMYECNTGYVLKGSHTVECKADGKWNYQRRPSCEPVDCGRPQPLMNGGVKAVKLTFGKSARYYCLEGHHMYGGPIVRCTENGHWNASAPVCKPVLCPTPVAPSGGRVAGDDHSFGHDILFSCDAGHVLVSNHVRTCQPDGTWSGTQPVCKVVKCMRPAQPRHGALHVAGVHVGDTAAFSCRPGYELLGRASSTCTPTGTWTSPQPRCLLREVRTCPQPRLPPEVSPVKGPFRVGDTVILRCAEGHEPEGKHSPQLYCKQDQTWSQPAQYCKRRSCGRPEGSALAMVMGKTFLYGDRVRYMCRMRLVAVTGPELVCQADGRWDALPRCRATCKFQCKNGGECVGRNRCRCAGGWGGPTCARPSCILDCLNGGRCTAPYVCTCPYGYTGTRCERPDCAQKCENKGYCIAPNRCSCPHGFRPPFCKVSIYNRTRR